MEQAQKVTSVTRFTFFLTSGGAVEFSASNMSADERAEVMENVWGKRDGFIVVADKVDGGSVYLRGQDVCAAKINVRDIGPNHPANICQGRR